MKVVKLMHNPKAGSEDHSKKEICKLIEEEGYECRYASVKKEGWREIESDIDLVAVAGGDGTVGKVVKELVLHKRLYGKAIPFAVLPLGTANNICRSLCIQGKTKHLIPAWQDAVLKKFDVGRVTRLEDGQGDFVEGVGFGALPAMIKDIKKLHEREEEEPEEEIVTAQRMLIDTIKDYDCPACLLEIDGEDYSGKYVMIEVMNIKSVGPGLRLAPDADMSDGLLDVVLIKDTEKDQLVSYVKSLIKETEYDEPFRIVKAKNIKITWRDEHIHVDDKLLKSDGHAELNISLEENSLSYLATAVTEE